MLLVLLALLVGPLLLAKLAGRLNPRWSVNVSTQFRLGLTACFLFTGLGHFVKGPEMARMLGPVFPFALTIVHVTGALEWLGAIGVWVPRLRRLTGWCLIVMLFGFLPVNVYSAIQRVPFGGHEVGPAYLLIRVPFQLLLIWWAAKATGVLLRPGRAAAEELASRSQ